MTDMTNRFKQYNEARRERRAALGVYCTNCAKKRPKATPKILLPGQMCWCGYVDPRAPEAERAAS